MPGLHDKTILVTSPQAWGKMFISKHHYAIGLAKKGNMVYFLNPPRQDRPFAREEISIQPSGIHDRLLLIDHSLGFPYDLKFHARPLFHLLMKPHIRKIMKRIGTVDIVWSFDLGDLYPFRLFGKGPYKIFHPVDEPLNKTALDSGKGADIVFSVTKEILAKYEHLRAPAHFINHGLSESFQHATVKAAGMANGAIHVGFAGNLLRNDIDRSVMLRIVQENPSIRFDFWGSYRMDQSNIGGAEDVSTREFITGLKASPNAVLHGAIPADRLAEAILDMDAFLIVYDVQKDQSRGTNYHKIMEYLSTGKVIISNNVSTYQDQPHLIQMVAERDHNGKLPVLFKTVTASLDHFNSPLLQQRRKEFAMDNTYEKQLARIEGLLPSAKPAIAIVVSHPIQHFCPQYVSISRHGNIRVKVFFASALGYKKYIDRNFNREIAWGNLRLDEFDHDFLNDGAVIQPDKDLDAPELDRALTEFRPDIVIVYGYFQKVQRRAYRWAHKNGVRLAYISDSERKQKRNAIREALKYPYIASYFRGIDRFLSVGNANEDFYRHHGVPDKKIIRMHFPIDVRQYRQCYEEKNALRTRIRNQYGIGSEEIVLSVVGKLVAWKRQDDIIDAMALLEKEGLALRLFIIGSGEMEPAWKEKAAALQKSKVEFTGFVSIDQLPAYYAATDIYVHPAAAEPHSLAISEAIYMGNPVIISDRCGSYGVSDDVQEEVNGYVYPCGDTDTLARLIKTLANNKDLRSAFGGHSHEMGAAFQQRAHSSYIQDLTKIVSL